jgi:hypothetical protein
MRKGKTEARNVKTPGRNKESLEKVSTEVLKHVVGGDSDGVGFSQGASTPVQRP